MASAIVPCIRARPFDKLRAGFQSGRIGRRNWDGHPLVLGFQGESIRQGEIVTVLPYNPAPATGAILLLSSARFSAGRSSFTSF